jgi:hypothetical protein
MDPDRTSSVEFFGVKLKVHDPRLAALLNSDVHEDVVVIGRRARDLMGPAGEDVPGEERQDEDAAGDERPDEGGSNEESADRAAPRGDDDA